MLICTNQAGTAAYRLYYYHLEKDAETERWHMVGFDRDTSNLVDLASYKYYEQAIAVFAEMVIAEGDLVYFKKRAPRYTMPPSIETEEGIRKFVGL